MITIYGMVGCKECTEAKKFCDETGIQYKYVEDPGKLLENARQANIRTAPVIEVEGSFMSFADFKTFIRNKKE